MFAKKTDFDCTIVNIIKHYVYDISRTRLVRSPSGMKNLYVLSSVLHNRVSLHRDAYKFTNLVKKLVRAKRLN